MCRAFMQHAPLVPVLPRRCQSHSASRAPIGIPSRATLALDIERCRSGCRIAGSGDRAAGDLTVVSRGLKNVSDVVIKL